MFRGNGHQKLIVTIGGTFDTLHKGHKEYIRLAFEYADRVLIYVNSNEYVKPKKSYDVRPYRLRVKRLKNFISKIGISEERYEIRQLNTVAQVKNDYLKEDIHIAIVIPEYYAMFRRINQQRMAKGKQGILILVKERTRDHKNGDLSSTEIHRRLIARRQNSSNGHMQIQAPVRNLKRY